MAGRPTGQPKTGGRKAGTPNKSTATLRDLAQPYTEEALDVLLTLMRDVTINPDTRLRAAMQILDRGHGKPRLELEVKHEVKNPFPSTEELDAMRAKALEDARKREEKMKLDRQALGIDISSLYEGTLQE